MFTVTSFLCRKETSTKHLDQQCCVAEDIILALLPSNKIGGCQVSGSLQKYTTDCRLSPELCEFPFVYIFFVLVYSRNMSQSSISHFMHCNEHNIMGKLKEIQCKCYVKFCLMYLEFLVHCLMMQAECIGTYSEMVCLFKLLGCYLS